MSLPRVAIIIINWNGYEYTKRCLESLYVCKYPNFRICLVDNASTDGSGDRLYQEFPGQHHINMSENTGFTGGNNVGMQWALGEGFECIMLLNNDTTVEPDFLSYLVESIQANPALAAVQPKMYFMHDKNKIWNAGGKFNKYLGITRSIGIGKLDSGQFDQSGHTDWITGCCLLVKSEVIRQVGMLDDRFFAYWEDVDWSFRMKSSGWQLWYDPRSKIYHVAGAASNTKEKGKEGFLSPMAIYLEVRNHMIIVKKYGKMPWVVLWWLWQFGKCSAYVVYLIVRRRPNKLSMTIKAVKEGLFG